jgi:hypothetical protein
VELELKEDASEHAERMLCPNSSGVSVSSRELLGMEIFVNLLACQSAPRSEDLPERCYMSKV